MLRVQNRVSYTGMIVRGNPEINGKSILLQKGVFCHLNV
jgi:hypothetical protein